jgi:hypothetical protein
MADVATAPPVEDIELETVPERDPTPDVDRDGELSPARRS